MPGDSDHQYQSDSDSLSFPQDTVVGIVGDPDGAASAVRALVEAGWSEDELHLLSGTEGAERLDPSGERHGLIGRLKRLVQNYGDEDLPHVRRQADELRKGHFLISVPATEDDRDRVAEILEANGGYFVNHYGDWSVTLLKK